jgi:DNA repair protein RecO (recombination protein O)
VNANRTRAIVLRRTNYGEADRVLQLITPNGKMSVMARGARREKSKLAGAIELFGISEIVVADGKGEIKTLTSAKLIHFYNHIMEDYDRMQFAYSAIKLVSNSSEMVAEPEWYEVLSETLMGLDALSIPIEIVEAWFYLHYSALLGHDLSLDRDVDNNKITADKKYRYDINERGLKPYENGELTSDHIKLLRIINSRPIKVIAQIGGINEIAPDCLLLARQHAAL